jgi:hypothetical protein
MRLDGIETDREPAPPDRPFTIIGSMAILLTRRAASLRCDLPATCAHPRTPRPAGATDDRAMAPRHELAIDPGAEDPEHLASRDAWQARSIGFVMEAKRKPVSRSIGPRAPTSTGSPREICGTTPAAVPARPPREGSLRCSRRSAFLCRSGGWGDGLRSAAGGDSFGGTAGSPSPPALTPITPAAHQRRRPLDGDESRRGRIHAGQGGEPTFPNTQGVRPGGRGSPRPPS